MLSSPTGPSFHLPCPDRGAGSSSFCRVRRAAVMLGPDEGAVSSLGQGGCTAGAQGTTDTQRPAAPGEGAGIQSRRLERAEGREPSPAPEEMPRRETQPKTKRNTGCLTPRSEVQPHPRPIKVSAAGRGGKPAIQVW